MLELKKINKIYESKAKVEVNALTDINIAFRECEFVSVLGPSGCGKTTLLNLIGGLDRYTSGEITVDGISTADFTDGDWDAYRNHKIGFVFQSYNLIPHQSILENVELALTLSGFPADRRKEKAMRALERVGLANHLRKRSNELSGGEMQRVAIARAIVNDPEIILADEPTGALDSKTSLQIMDLLKEISKDRLVIMVTHNDTLANAYSTRIVKLLDSKIVYDSNPYNPEKEAEQERLKIQKEREKSLKKSINGKNAKVKGKNKNQSHVSVKDKKGNGGKEKKTSMSFGVAISLSLKNLLTKKTRTILTAIASSIGIVGLALVLALFNGLSAFIDKVQYDTLSAYPMYVSTWEENDPEKYLSILVDQDNYFSDAKKDDMIFVSHLITKLNTEAKIKNIITEDYVEHVKNAPKEYVNEVRYDYGTTINIFKKKAVLDTKKYGKMPSGVPESIMLKYPTIPVGSYFKEMAGGKDFILSQYDLVAGKYPESKQDLVLFLDKNNHITDTVLLAFLMDIDATAKDSEGNFIVNQYRYDDFLGELQPDGTRKESNYGTFTFAYNNGLYKESSSKPGFYEAQYCSGRDMLIKNKYGDDVVDEFIKRLKNMNIHLPNCYSGPESETMDLKIVGIMRPKDDTTVGSMNMFPIGYTKELSEYAREKAFVSEIVKAQLKEGENLSDNNPSTVCKNLLLDGNGNQKGNITDEGGYKYVLRCMGYSDIPNKIEFYPSSFENKVALKKYLSKYNEKPEISADDNKKVFATDMVSTVLSVVKVFINAIISILLSLTAISLVVAAIMIGIITYVSVIERTKEIGILRSIGARKIDITSVFNAETIIIGLFAGCLGILFALILQWPLNAILFSFTGISSLASLSPLHALILVLVSVVITLLSGAIPAILAARRDPVKALRAE